jgi:hypothetical protein
MIFHGIAAKGDLRYKAHWKKARMYNYSLTVTDVG